MKADHPHTITAKPRPLHLLYYINDDVDLACLRRLLLKNLALWGGRYNPIIPLFQNRLTTQWEQILKYQDPDYVYYSPGIDKELIIGICERFEHNPIEIIELDERLLDVFGVHFANIMPVVPAMILPRVYNLSGVGTPLADFYALNLFVEDTLPVNTEATWTQENDGLFRKHQLFLLNKGNFQSLNNIWSATHVSSITKLSELNVNTYRLRLSNPTFHGFELVVSADEKGFEELIYHWNKQLYDIFSWQPLTIMTTESELNLLLADPAFKLVLKKYSGQSLTVSVVSFSLEKEKIDGIVATLKAYSNHNDFARKDVVDFPFPIRDREGFNQQVVYEKESVQVVFRGQPFIFIPPLSFELTFKPFSQRYSFNLKISEVLGPFNKSLRFPIKFNSDVLLQNSSRINRARLISIDVNESLHLEGKMTLNIYEFYHVVSMVITTPKVTGSKEIRNLYRSIAFSDGSNRLSQFLKLFDDDFSFVQNYLHDKFWNDIFNELSDNNRTEGDTITFEEIFTRCKTLLIDQGREFTEKENGRYNDENLKLGLTSMVQDLIDHKIMLPGYVIKCKSCSSKVWYSIDEISNVVTCKGCSNKNHFIAETPISYKLNHLIKNNYGMKDDRGVFMPDGNMTAIFTLVHIWNKAVNSFQYLPQIDIFDCSNEPKPKTDLDIVALSSGDFYIGECKHNSKAFSAESHKCLDNLIEIAETAKPDKIIISCTIDENEKLHKAAEYLRHEMKKWNNPPEVIELKTWDPLYFSPSDSKYFLH